MLAALLLIALPVALALAQARFDPLAPSEVELEDIIEVEVMGRDLYAYDLLGTASPVVSLEIGEVLLYSQARGRIAMALTNRRALAVSSGAGGWHEIRYRVHETAPPSARIGKRVLLVVTDKRALGYDSTSGSWIERVLGPQERVEFASVGDSTAVVVTNRRAYGLSPSSGGFFETDLAIHERIEGLRVKANMATISTSKRILVFRAPTGTWTEQQRRLH